MSAGLRARPRLALVLIVLALPAAASGQDGDVERGRRLYVERCISCHGPNGEGVVPLAPERGAGGTRGLGPPLGDAGARAADFYLSTGRMPLDDPYAAPERSEPAFDEQQLDALVAYVASLGDGPPIPEPRPERGSVSEGLELFTEKCAGCHQVAAAGGVVTGARVPPLEDVPAVQIAEAVRIGPYLMPRFSERDLSDAQLDSVIRYVQRVASARDEGGWGIGHLGPIPEGMVTWLLAVVALVAACAVIGKRVGS
jgi:ubiquinol-cytochrome c reductase cytochrome c subunit